MNEMEKRLVDAVLGAYAVGTSPLAPRDGEVDYVGVIETLLEHANPIGAAGVRAALWMVATAPAWHWRRPETVLSLSPEERCRLVEELLAHQLFAVRELAILLKIQAGMALMGASSVRGRTDYDGPKTAARRLSVLGGEA